MSAEKGLKAPFRNIWINLPFYSHVNQSLFMVYPCNVKTIECDLLLEKSHFLRCIATIKLLQSVRLVQFIPSKTSYWKCFPSIAKRKLLNKNVERNLKELMLRVTKWNIELDHSIVLKVVSSQHNLQLISIVKLQRNIAQPNQEKLMSATFLSSVR